MIQRSTLVLFGTFLGVGDEIVYIFNYFISPDEPSPIIEFFFLMPAILALIQLILCCIKFRFDTMQQLIEDKSQEWCVIELGKIYATPNGKIKAFNEIIGYMNQIRRRYPRYSDFFRNPYRKRLLKGIAMIIMRNFNGLFVSGIFASEIMEGSNYSLITYIFNILGTLIPFFLVDSTFILHLAYGKKPFLLFGNIGIFILHITLLLLIGLSLSMNIIFVVFMFEFLIYGMSTYTLAFVYAVETLTERGFSITMMVYWITISVSIISFSLLFKPEEHGKFVPMSYIAFGAVVVACVPYCVILGYLFCECSCCRD